MKNYLIVSCALLAPAFSAAANAAPVTYNWTGAYAGVNAGAAFSNFNPKTTVGPFTYFADSSAASIDANGSPHISGNGFVGGAQIGYNYQAGHVVYGIQADFDALDTSASNTTTKVYPDFSPTTYTIHQSVKTTSLFTARPRIGWVQGNTMVYVTGGLADAQIKYDSSFTDTFDSVTGNSSKSDSKLGSVFGVGAEFAVAKSYSIDAEYLYASFGRISTSGALNIPGDEGSATLNHSTNLNSSIVRLSLNFKF